MPTIALDATTTFAGAGGTSWSHTCSGSNRILIVGLVTSNNVSNPATTYNGVAMTFIGSISNGSVDTVNLFYLIAPTTGTNTISVSIGGANLNSGYSVSYTGTKQSGQPDNSGTQQDNNADTSYSQSLVPNLNNCWLVGLVFARSGGASAGTGTTARATLPGGKGIYDSNGIVPQLISSSLNWTASGGTGWDSVIMSLVATDSLSNNTIFYGSEF